jgi:hypothetical protein
VSEDQIQKKEKQLKKIKIYHLMQKKNQKRLKNGLTRDLGDLELRPAWVSKVIGTKHENYLMVIFNSKAKILIKTLN